jgi:hypothetical protein
MATLSETASKARRCIEDLLSAPASFFDPIGYGLLERWAAERSSVWPLEDC